MRKEALLTPSTGASVVSGVSLSGLLMMKTTGSHFYINIYPVASLNISIDGTVA